MSFPQLNQISQSDQDSLFILFSLMFKASVMIRSFLQFQSNLYVVLACEKGPQNSVHRDLFKTKKLKQKKPSCVLRTL